ncbi:unnamed protein product [Adineta steineri]|uniref:Uncharacterized protein n=1 Tax=Adineta steineri TaxID=433720 RepID=A0A816CFH6_9BILA|nr:unnamed protein product [Adineta steineri]CAF1622612.1 unnamed protein product [Adineta steineri]
MPLSSFNESQNFQFEQRLNSNYYREYVLNNRSPPRPIPVSPRSQRLNSRNGNRLTIFDQLFNNQKDFLTIDRAAYKIRMKSDLNINTLRDATHRSYHQVHNRINSNILPPPATTTMKTNSRQPTVLAMTTISKKTINNNNALKGIEGNSICVETVDKIIKQIHNIEVRPVNNFDNSLISISNNQSNNEYRAPKSSLTLERIVKQPQALTECQFNVPSLVRISSRLQGTEKSNDIDSIDQSYETLNSLEQQSSMTNSQDIRIQKSRKKSLKHSEKQVYVCSKLNLNYPNRYKRKEPIISVSKHPTARFIIPCMNSYSYFTKQSTDELPSLTTKKIQEQTFLKDSFQQSSIYLDEHSQFLNNTIKSMIGLTDYDDDLRNPPNTIINSDTQQDT